MLPISSECGYICARSHSEPLQVHGDWQHSQAARTLNECQAFIATTTGASPSGKAAGFDPAMRWFKSSRPCHIPDLVQHRTSIFKFSVNAIWPDALPKVTHISVLSHGFLTCPDGLSPDQSCGLLPINPLLAKPVRTGEHRQQVAGACRGPFG